ncbi:MAG: VanZ family protein [Gammaproteobacteria bacterium]
MSTHKLRKVWLFTGWLLIALVVYVSLIPALPSIDITAADKVAHVFAYATLTLWFLQLYPADRRAMLVIGFIMMGIALEFLQELTASRSFEYVDIAANTGGVVLGWLLAKTRLSNTLHVIEKQLIRV